MQLPLPAPAPWRGVTQRCTSLFCTFAFCFWSHCQHLCRALFYTCCAWLGPLYHGLVGYYCPPLYCYCPAACYYFTILLISRACILFAHCRPRACTGLYSALLFLLIVVIPVFFFGGYLPPCALVLFCTYCALVGGQGLVYCQL